MAMAMAHRYSNDLWLKSCIVKGNMKLKCKKTLRNETHLKKQTNSGVTCDVIVSV